MSDKFFVRYRNDTYDLTEFVKKHPGGVNTLNGMLNTDIDTKFDKASPHSDSAKYLMKEYQVNKSKQKNKTKTNDNNNNNNCDAEILNNNDENENVDDLVHTDDTMEHLVDWSRGMVAQIAGIGEKYVEWVDKPVDRPLRLFDSDALEMLTKTPWWVVPTIWIPTIITVLYLATKETFNDGYGINYVIFRFLLGIGIWTLLEYSLHRWVFHLPARNRGPNYRTFHFLMHGLHHKVPFDPMRLVFPPVPAVILASILYTPMSFLFDHPKLLLAGALFGYLIYDMIHYYIHYGSPSGGHLYYMKRYHYQHHFVHHDSGFGISSSIWDDAFGTKIILRKLKYLLKW